MRRTTFLMVISILAVAGLGAFLLMRRHQEPKPVPVARRVMAGRIGPELAEKKAHSPSDIPLPSVSPPHLAGLSSSVCVVLGAAEKKDYIVRAKAVRDIGERLSDAEMSALCDFLERKQGEDALSVNELSSLKNDVVNVLRSQKVRPTGLTAHLIKMYNDPSRDTLWRSYCIQHLGLLYPSAPDDAEKEAIRKTLWEATENVGTSIGPTALIALADNIGQEGMDAGKIKDAALSVSQNADCGEPARITALQICANLSESRVLPGALRLAQTEGSVPLRMSAIAAVGAMGGQSDCAMLGELARSGETRLRTAAQSALDRIGERMKQKVFGASSDIVQTD